MVVRSELIARANKQHDQISGGQNNGVAEVLEGLSIAVI